MVNDLCNRVGSEWSVSYVNRAESEWSMTYLNHVEVSGQ